MYTILKAFGEVKGNKMKILFVEPYARTLFSFRKELLDELINRGYEIVICTSVTKRLIEEYKTKVSDIIDVQLDLKDKSPFKNLKLKKKYKKIIKTAKPDIILSYTIKPNIFCALFAENIPMIANITGLGNMFKSKSFLSKIGIFLYRKSFKNVNYVFFQNNDSYQFFLNNKITIKNYRIIPGSGVNTNMFVPLELKDNNEAINFLFASRAIKEKGFDLLIDIIPDIIKENKRVHFNFLSAEEDVLSSNKAKELFENYKEYLTLLDRTDNMEEIYHQNDFLVSPSFYREGISNVLLESLASGRPIITTKDNPGCKEVLVDGINGFGVLSNDRVSLKEAILKASKLSKDTINKMGLAGREFVVKNFDRRIVIDNYLSVIKLLVEDKESNCN